MKESALWGHLKPRLSARGKFQKLSDRFTPGVPDILGCFLSAGIAIELKELTGVRVIRAEFQPGQLDWLEDWYKSGGYSWIVSTWDNWALVHPWHCGVYLERGVTVEEMGNLSVLCLQITRKNFWNDFTHQLLNLKRGD